jgi:hypothetical protein
LIRRKQGREVTCCHSPADLAGVASVVEEVGVDVEGDCDPGVAENAADLGDVEAEVDDQVAGEGVAQVVEAQRRPAVFGRSAASREICANAAALRWS